MFHYVTENGSIEMQIEDVECLGRRFSDVYDVGPRKDITVLGKGGFSSVIVGKHKDTNVEFAVKITNTSKMKPKSAARLRSEFEIQRILSHKNIVKTYNYFDEPPTNFIVMEYVRGGELFSRIVKKTFYSECDARKVGHILLSAVAHMHAHKIAHRDLKPENILLLVRILFLSGVVFAFDRGVNWCVLFSSFFAHTENLLPSFVPRTKTTIHQ